uniref:DEAH-box helicase 35 n=1 Tax=Canis lupus dingo TaxID=286419 RepID=A0A8C0KIB6_CANLU
AAPVGPVRFWRPGTEGPGVSISEERQSLAENSATTVVYNPYAALSIEQQRQKLPVFKLRNHILYLVENYQTVVIVGETGCGKSTQIPQYLAEAGWTAEGRVVGVTQPRRVAAVTVSFFSMLQKSPSASSVSVTYFFLFPQSPK